MTTEHSSQRSSAPDDVFATTHWTVVLTAGEARSPESSHALEMLCRAYWFPLYAYVRRRGFAKEDAEDLTQAFFTRLLERNPFADLKSDKGKFRAFLLASLKHFLANAWDKARTQKRGGGNTLLSLDWETADSKFQVAATDEPSPDRAFDREWAVALLARVIERLQRDCAAEGKAKLFEHLKVFLMAGHTGTTQLAVADALGMEETAVRVAVHRLRKRYRQLLRSEVANTLADPQSVEEEMRALFGAFS